MEGEHQRDVTRDRVEGEHADASLRTEWRVSRQRDVTRDTVGSEHAERRHYGHSGGWAHRETSLETLWRVTTQRDVTRGQSGE